MSVRLASAFVLAVLSIALAACAAGPQSGTGAGSAPSDSAPPSATAPGAGQPDPSGSSAAPGMWDQPDGTVAALGTLEFRDIEGGVWMVTDGTKTTGGAGAVVAVIANAREFENQLRSLKGQRVTVVGTKAGGVSIRMAGPEIKATSITATPDSGGPAQ